MKDMHTFKIVGFRPPKIPNLFSEALSFVRGRHINGCEPSPVELSGGFWGDSQICGNDGISNKPVSRVKVVERDII